MKPINIYVDGVFDLTHYGHFALFEKIKTVYPYSTLIIGVSSDEDCIQHKKKTILTQDERCKMISYCKYVDIILKKIPWIIDENFLEKHSIDYICHDPNAYSQNDIGDIYKKWKDKGIFIGINRLKGISTSDIVNRIKSQHQIQCQN